MRCKSGYRARSGKCVKSVYSSASASKNEINNVIYFLIGGLFLMGLLWVVIPDSREAMGIYFFLTVISLTVYILAIFRVLNLQNLLIGIGSKNWLKSVSYALLFGFSFYILTKLVPGLSIGLPRLPQSISTGVRAFIVNFIAPWFETFFVQGAFFGYIKIKIKNIWVAIIIQAVFMALLHLTAYIAGFYNYPTFTLGMGAVLANISSFFVVFIYAFLAGWFVSKDGIKNLLFVGVFHTILNIILYTKEVITFV